MLPYPSPVLAICLSLLFRARFTADLVPLITVIDSTVEAVDSSAAGIQRLKVLNCYRIQPDKEGIETQEPFDLDICLKDRKSSPTSLSIPKTGHNSRAAGANSRTKRIKAH